MEATVFLRFYEELNDYLPARRRKSTFRYGVGDGATIGAMLAGVGVPADLVDLILVNGESADLGHRLLNGDRVSVYPVFESFDISALARLPDRPLRQLRFVADAHLGKLASYLRLLGFDTLFRNDYRDAELVVVSRDQERILLTRDRALSQRRDLVRGYLVRSTRPRRQLLEVLARFDLAAAVKPFRRCLRCNAVVERTKSDENLDALPPVIRKCHSAFWFCPGCGRVYWQGSHYLRMQRFVDQVLQEARNLRQADGSHSAPRP